MLFANPAYDATHNTDQPATGSTYESVRKPWQLIGRYHYDQYLDQVYSPIGKRLLASAGHIGAWIGQPIDIQGLNVHVVAWENSPAGMDIVYCTVDQDIPQWFGRLKSTDIYNNGSNILVIGGGIGSAGYVVDSEGWPYVQEGGPETMRMRWGIQKADYIGNHNLYPPNPAQPYPPPFQTWGTFFRHHDDPHGHPETSAAATADSGSAALVNCGPVKDPWVYIGCVGGPGTRYLSPYKGQVVTGYGGAMIYLDEEYIRVKNGEPRPIVDKPAVKKPVVQPPIPPLLTGFNAAITQGMATAESMWGERFVLDGDPKFYVGTFNQWQGSQQISPGGFELHADGIMVASKPQFGTVKPRYGQRLTIGPRRYIAVEVHEDIASWDLVLKGTDE